MKSRFVADRSYRMINEDGDLVVCCVVKGYNRSAATMALNECKGQMLDVEMRPHKSSRSLAQNRMLWALLEKLAEATSGYKRQSTVEECYCDALVENNAAYDYVLTLPESENSLRQCYRVIRKVGERNVNGKTLNLYQAFVGSSKFDTKEMTDLIETVLDRLAELGVYDSEIECARQEYLR